MGTHWGRGSLRTLFILRVFQILGLRPVLATINGLTKDEVSLPVDRGPAEIESDSRVHADLRVRIHNQNITTTVLELPYLRKQGDVVWKRPTYATIHRMIVNPAYGGAYAYGKTRSSPGFETSAVHRQDRDEWLALKPGAHEGYVSWERAEAIRKMVSDNVPQSRHHGAAKHGSALLAGLLRCRRCGRKLTVRYTGKKHNIPRYSCWRGLLDNGEARCIAFGGLRVDDAIEHALLQVVGPGAIAAAEAAARQAAHQRDQVRDALCRDLEAAQYATDRAFRQYDASDPENRLVTAELEARWNRTLQQVQEIEHKLALHDTVCPNRTALPVEDLAALGADLKRVWFAPITDAKLKKRIIPTASASDSRRIPSRSRT